MADFIGDILGDAVDVVGDIVGSPLGRAAADIGGAFFGMPGLGTLAQAGTSLFSSNTAKGATGAQTQGIEQSTATLWDMYRQSREDQLPWMQAGMRSLADLEKKVSAGPGEFTESPGYQFRLAEGNKNILRNASAAGRLASGRTLKELERYGQDYGSNEYDKFIGRYYDSLKPYQSLSGVGQTTATNVGQQGIYTGQNVGQNQIAAGQASASGYINQANPLISGIQSGLNALGTFTGMGGGSSSTTELAGIGNLFGNAFDLGW